MIQGPLPHFLIPHHRSVLRGARVPPRRGVNRGTISHATPSGGEGRVRTHPAEFRYASAVPAVTNRWCLWVASVGAASRERFQRLRSRRRENRHNSMAA